MHFTVMGFLLTLATSCVVDDSSQESKATRSLPLDREGGVGEIRQLEWVKSAGSQFVCSLTTDGAVHVWAQGSEQPLGGIGSIDSRIILIQAVSPLEGLLVALCADGKLIGIEVPKLTQQFVLEQGKSVVDNSEYPTCHGPALLTWRARTRTLLFASRDFASAWALDKRRLKFRMTPADFSPEWSRFASVAISPKEDSIVATGTAIGERDVTGPALAITLGDKERRVWQPLSGNGPQCRNIYFTDSGDQLILTAPTEVAATNQNSENQVAGIWDLKTRTKVRDLTMKEAPHGYSAQFVMSDDGGYVAGQIGFQAALVLWDLKAKTQPTNYGPTWSIPSGGPTHTTHMKFSKSGETLFAKQRANLVTIQLKSLEHRVVGQSDGRVYTRYSNVWDLPIDQDETFGAAATDGRVRFLKLLP